MAVSPVRQITPDSACRGLVQHTPPLQPKCIEGCAEEVNRSFTQCKFRATFRDNPRTIEPMWPPSTLHHMIHASGTPGRNPHRHGGHLFNTGASCISTHTRLKARPETHTCPNTHLDTEVLMKCCLSTWIYSIVDQ